MSLELGEGLREAGMEVHFLTARWGSGEFARRAKERGFAVDRMWLGFISATLKWEPIRMTLDQARRWPALLLSYRHFLRRVKPTKVIHTNWHHVILLWPFLRKNRDIYWAHEVMANSWQYRTLFRRFSSRFGRFVGVSKASAEALGTLGVDSSKLSVIYNGIDTGTFSKAGERQRDHRVGIVGQIGSWKGHEELLQAMAIVRHRIAQVELHIFGSGETDYLDYLKRTAQELGIAHTVKWRGFVASQDEIYSSVDLVVIPSRVTESFGMTAIEAALFELPVVATRRGGLSEIVEDGKTGYLVEAERPDELAERIAQLLESPALQKRFGGAARERISEKFNRSRMVRDFLKVLGSEN